MYWWWHGYCVNRGKGISEMEKVISAKDATLFIKDGMSVMVGGFMCCGTPEGIIDEVVETNTKDLTIICNDAGYVDRGVGKLIAKGRVKRLIASHIGLNPIAGQKMHDGEIEVFLIPQGTLVERIRSAGAGLGGVLTPTGIGTIVAEGKRIIEVQGKQYLLEEPLFADVALISGYIVDKSGNVYYRGATRNFNTVMATAATTVIAEADCLVDIGEITPECVHTPGLFVDYIVKGSGTCE